jgi:hypothetical protein
MRRISRRPPRPLPVLLLTFWAGSALFLFAADKDKGQPEGVDYLEPALLTGIIRAKPPEPKRILFTFRRTAVRAGSTVRVLREYNRPNGIVAARERVMYEGGRLVSCQLEELQSGGSGSAVVRPDPKAPNERQIVFEYTQDHTKKTGIERLDKDTLINDMVGPFLAAHWDALRSGSAVKFRFAVIPRAETVGFKLTREAETTRDGKTVVVVRMEPTSWIIARWVDPLFFTVEKEGQHRVLQYVGRTTPRIQTGNGWEDLDALTVFDWK